MAKNEPCRDTWAVFTVNSGEHGHIPSETRLSEESSDAGVRMTFYSVPCGNQEAEGFTGVADEWTWILFSSTGLSPG